MLPYWERTGKEYLIKQLELKEREKEGRREVERNSSA